MRSQQSFLSWFLWLLLRFFFLSLVFSNLIIMWLDVVFSVFILFGLHWTSKISGLIFLIKSGKVFSSIPETPITYMLEHLIVYSLCSFYPFFLSVLQSEYFLLSCLKVLWLCRQILKWLPMICLLLFTPSCNLVGGLDLVTYFWWIKYSKSVETSLLRLDYKWLWLIPYYFSLALGYTDKATVWASL